MRSITLPFLFAAAFAAPAMATYLGPTPYLSAADSPFAGQSFTYFHLDNFENGVIVVPGLSAGGGHIVAAGPFTDSVDADDGAIDGSGLSGHSYFSGGTSSAFTFTFDAAALGGLPTHAGLVWTDVGQVLTGTSQGVSDVRFEAFDALGVSMGVHGPFTLGDGLATGGTAEDRFFGAVNLGGISRLVISMPDSADWEVDHVQFGRIPSPAAGIAFLGLSLCVRRRR